MGGEYICDDTQSCMQWLFAKRMNLRCRSGSITVTLAVAAGRLDAPALSLVTLPTKLPPALVTNLADCGAVMAAGGAQLGWVGGHGKSVERGCGTALFPWGYQPAFQALKEAHDKGAAGEVCLTEFASTLTSFVAQVHRALLSECSAPSMMQRGNF